jgi:hypothetical protein
MSNSNNKNRDDFHYELIEVALSEFDVNDAMMACPYKPGSPEKIAFLYYRYHNNIELWKDGDKKENDADHFAFVGWPD